MSPYILEFLRAGRDPFAKFGKDNFVRESQPNLKAVYADFDSAGDQLVLNAHEYILGIVGAGGKITEVTYIECYRADSAGRQK
jgi:hypothetical protein